MMKNLSESPFRLVVLSVDGMRPDFYRHPEKFGLKIPNLRKLVAAGASANAVESVYPSTTYPAHATLVTGVRPRRHGIYSHLASLDPTEKARPWSWFARAINVPTLWDVAKASGIKTAAISWPVSAGARIDYNIPEIWDPSAPDPLQDFDTAARHSTPGFFNEILASIKPQGSQSAKGRRQISLKKISGDRLRADAALYIWKRYRPGLLLVHFVFYDSLAHRLGPFAPEALAAIEDMDKEIGRIADAIAPGRSSTLVVLSDHGFVPVRQDAAPLVVLIQEGLLGRNVCGEPELRRLGAVHCGGSFAMYWLEEPTQENRRALQRAVARIKESGAVGEVVTKEKLESLDADPDAELMLDAAPDFYFSGRCTGPLVQNPASDQGTHGQLPSTAGMEAAFVAVGPKIKPGKKLGRLSLTQIAPTLADQMDLTQGILASETGPLDLT